MLKRLALIALIAIGLPTCAFAQLLPGKQLAPGAVQYNLGSPTGFPYFNGSSAPAFSTTIPFTSLSGSATCPQLPALTGAVTTAGCAATLGSSVVNDANVASGAAINASKSLFVPPGANAGSVSLSSFLGQLVLPITYGITCNGTDETAKWNNLFTDFSDGALVILPAGLCVYSTLSVPSNFTFYGSSYSHTCMQTNSATTNGLTLANADVFQDVCFSSSVTATGGSFVNIQGNGDVLQRIVCQGYYICVNVGTLGGTQAVKPTFRDISFSSPSVGVGSCSIVFQNFSNVIADGLVGAGPTTGQEQDCGLKFINGDTGYISNSNLTHEGISLDIVPSAGSNTFSLQFVNDDFDSGGLISGSSNAPSCSIGGAGNVNETTMTNVWCGLSKADGLLVQSYGSGLVDGLHIATPMFEGNAGNGLHVDAGVTNWDVSGGSASGNTLSGVYISAASTHWSIAGLKADANTARGPNGRYGLDIGTSASDYYSVIGSDFTGNTAGTLYDGGTGTHKVGITSPALNFN